MGFPSLLKTLLKAEVKNRSWEPHTHCRLSPSNGEGLEEEMARDGDGMKQRESKETNLTAILKETWILDR
jgi:hypothetical protein